MRCAEVRAKLAGMLAIVYASCGGPLVTLAQAAECVGQATVTLNAAGGVATRMLDATNCTNQIDNCAGQNVAGTCLVQTAGGRTWCGCTANEPKSCHLAVVAAAGGAPSTIDCSGTCPDVTVEKKLRHQKCCPTYLGGPQGRIAGNCGCTCDLVGQIFAKCPDYQVPAGVPLDVCGPGGVHPKP